MLASLPVHISGRCCQEEQRLCLGITDIKEITSQFDPQTPPRLWIIGSFGKDTVAGDKRTEPKGWNIIIIASSVVDGERGELA